MVATRGARAGLDPEQLRYVTRHLQTSQQGLTGAVIGVGVFLAETADLYTLNRATSLVIDVFEAVALVAVFRLVPRYYERRFGCVEPSAPSNKAIAVFFAVMLALLVFGRDLAGFLDPILARASYRLYLLISDPTHQVKPYALLFWIVLVCVSISGRSRRMDRYSTHFQLFGLIASAFVALCPLVRPQVMQSMLWRVLNAGSLGISFIALGLYDHFTLLQLLPKPATEDEL